jgi:hypothetical protein
MHVFTQAGGGGGGGGDGDGGGGSGGEANKRQMRDACSAMQTSTYMQQQCIQGHQ